MPPRIVDDARMQSHIALFYFLIVGDHYRTVNIDIHFYSISKDLAAQTTRRLVVPEHSTLEDVLNILFLEVPSLASIRKSCLFAVGTSYAPMTISLSEGDQVSIIPPMQGG